MGIDEVGRGCWAGPLVAAAVLIVKPIDGLRDSKCLTPKQRTILSDKIKNFSLCGFGWVWPKEIDKLGLTQATSRAMQMALHTIPRNYETVVIDGSYNFLPANPKVQTQVRADRFLPAVSAASIIAKVARDTYMADQALKYPRYGFESHVGYGTKQHIDAIKMLGVCDIHRLSYRPIKAFV